MDGDRLRLPDKSSIRPELLAKLLAELLPPKRKGRGACKRTDNPRAKSRSVRLVRMARVVNGRMKIEDVPETDV